MAAKPPDFTKDFGETLKALRQERGWTQQTLADRAQTDFQRISKYERGVAFPTTDMVVKLAEVLQVSIDHLLRGENVVDAPTLYDPELVKILEALRRLPSKEQETLKDLMNAYLFRHGIDLKD